MHYYVLTPWISWALFLSVTLGAFLRGGREERTAASALVASVLLTVASRDNSWAATQWGVFAGDVGYFGVVLWIALRSHRFWPIWAAGFQLLNLATHLAQELDPGVRAWAYASAQVIFTWLGTIAIGFGVMANWRERQGVGSPAHSHR